MKNPARLGLAIVVALGSIVASTAAAHSANQAVTETSLYVHTGRRYATITVPRSQRGRIAMSWGNTDSDDVASRSFQVGPCAGPGAWIVFPGGWYVTEPGCYQLQVQVGRTVTPIRVGIGAPCVGQLPPAA